MATVVPQSRGPRRNIGGGVGAGVAAFFGQREKQDFQRTLAEAEQSGDKDTYRKLLMDKAESLEDALTVDKIVNRKFPDATEEIIGYDETGAERKLRIPPNLDQAKRDQLLRSKGLQATKPLGKAEPFEDAQGIATGSFLPGRQPKGSRRTSSAEAARDRRSREGIAAKGRAASADTPNKRQGRILERMAQNTAAGKDVNDGLEGEDAKLVQSLFGDPAITNAFKALSQNSTFFRLLRTDLPAAFEMVRASARMLSDSQGSAGKKGADSSSEAAKLPPAAENEGRIARMKSGTRYKSNGTDWIEIVDGSPGTNPMQRGQ